MDKPYTKTQPDEYGVDRLVWMFLIQPVPDNDVQRPKFFTTARGYGEFKGQREFPGGKIEEGETPQQALIRGA